MYTRVGDDGKTSLYGSTRVPKDSARVEAYGTVDELNSCLGAAVSSSVHKEISDELRWIQGRLFVVGADLASERLRGGQSARVPRIQRRDVERLETMVDRFQAKLPRLTRFILPGGSQLSASLHVSRSVCRRAERRVVALSAKEEINPELVPFLNRLSTYLFNAARYANALENVKDEVWESD